MKDIWSKKKVGELLVFLHHISLHLLLPNFFPSKTEDYLEKFTTMQAETKWLILEGKLTKIPFCLCLSFIFCPRKVLKWEESVKLLNAEVTLKCMSKKSQKYIPLMGDTRICSKIAEHTFFFDIQNTAAEPPKRSVGFYSSYNQKPFLGVMGFSSMKKSNICTFQGQSRSMILLSLTLQYYLVL